MHHHHESCACGTHEANQHTCGTTGHKHGENCGCHSEDHHHEHGENCGCHSEDHHHEHGENCGCGHAHIAIATPEGLTPLQVDFLMALRQRQCLPVACFSYAKTDDEAKSGIALAPVYMTSPDDTMEQVKRLGKELSTLEDMDLIQLDYDIPLQNYPYEEYRTSTLYAYFVQTVETAAKQPNPTFDTPRLDLGSMVLTDRGDEMVDALLSLSTTESQG